MQVRRIGPVIEAERGVRAIAAASLAIAVSLLASRATAQDRPTLSGSWTASALSESWTVSDWSDACGPKPAPEGAGGGAVEIREQGGELSILGAGRAFSTAQCWEQMPGVGRASHSQSGGGRFWRTRCTSAPNDSRQTKITTTIQATDSSISLNETGDYQFVVSGATCHASVVRSRSFSLVHRAGEAPPAPSASATPASVATTRPPPPAPEPRAPSRCNGTAGDPARLEVHPGRKLLRAGDSFAFRAVVVDAEGCPTGTRPTWSLLPGPLTAKAAVDAAGTLSVAADAGEGKLEVSASVGGKGVTVIVEVATPDHYDALLGASGLNAAGEADQAAVAVIAAGTIGGRTGVAEDAARERKILFVAIVGALAAALGFFGLVLTRRGKHRDPAPLALAEEEAPGDAQEGGSPAPPTPAKVARPAPRPPDAPRKPGRGKICPTCGERYDGEATFCGKDATKLVLLN